MDPLLLRLAGVAVVIAATAIAGRLAVRRRDRLDIVRTPVPDPVPVTTASVATDVGGGSVSAILYGSPTCAPCDTLKTLLTDVAAVRPSLRWEYVDAAEHLDRAREHGVRRVPTLVVLDDTGAVTARSGGVPHKHELIAAIDHAASDGTAATVTVRSA